MCVTVGVSLPEFMDFEPFCVWSILMVNEMFYFCQSTQEVRGVVYGTRGSLASFKWAKHAFDFHYAMLFLQDLR